MKTASEIIADRLKAKPPTPWSNGHGEAEILDATQSVVALIVGNNPDRKLIVASVNHADKLAEALRDLIGKIEEMHGCMEVNYAEGHEECYPEFDKARSEIAAYEAAQ